MYMFSPPGVSFTKDAGNKQRNRRISMSLCSSLRGSRLLSAALFATFVVAVSASAVAQSDSTPKFDVFGGYQWLHPGATVPQSTGDPENPLAFQLPDMPKGIGGAFTYNMDRHWGLETDLGYSRD